MFSKSRNRLIIFTRYPESGITKTRLIPILGADGAANLHRKMTEHTLSRMEGLTASNDLTLEIRYNGGNEKLMRRWLGSKFEYASQGDGDLGKRMQRAFEDVFESGTASAVIIGTDIPDLTVNILKKAFSALEQKEMVLGPAKDGGYYLIGFKKTAFSPAVGGLFSGITWGEHDVLKKTIKIAMGIGIDYFLLDELDDVDRPEDLSIWERSQSSIYGDVTPNGISVIIPALNEAHNLADTINSIGHGNNTEIIVVDGGSSDDTVSIARQLGATVIDSSPPRSKQMNQGADSASKNILLFLHADTILPENFDCYVLGALEQSGVVAGSFKLCIDSPVPSLKFVERIANWRSRYLKMPYGDQAIFMFSNIFHQVGGFSNIPIMEDFELIRRFQRIGEVMTLPVPVVTSPRRWLKHGILKITLINQMIVLLYFLGITPDTIFRLYGRSKGILTHHDH
ncbi:MAG TPA: TIGR04283 family arsenosugar biosynthesis glycosyltransferase [Desulfobacterales bacterium]|nr:TIGR04283 family arsenosugar biosynthesis glycosyltransferase [Desulfobacterales bacterium]